MKIEYTTFSVIGKRRANQDVCRVVEMPKQNRILMIVCDGMGGGSHSIRMICTPFTGQK